ncbi:hemolymph lipopolysaccharide-binding protein-like [Bacillus rossius redtenbacheri]|uniref:hemolymph lipopolysaccharide-binding protein-like n=1 Tax=Bacillus rossius redtenbacheri TaxID=93214 RepID=UPI002FDE0ADD
MAGAVGHCAWLLGLLLVTSCEPEPQCSSLAPGGVHFALSSGRNRTGHWRTQVQLNHENNPSGNATLETGLWEVDIKQTVKKCEEREIIGIVASVTAPPVRAVPGYELVPGLGYYKLHTYTKPWLEARQTCSEEGAHLAIVNSEQELKVLHRIYQMYPKIQEGWRNDCAYLGFHDMYKEGQYITIFGEPLADTGFSKFAPGDPSDKTGTENCGCTCRNKELFDVGCANLLPFFCEQEIM